MKHIYLITAVCVILSFCRCGAASKSDPVRSFIPGVYARAITNEFSTGNDTLLIAVLSQQGNSYQIVHRSSFQRIINNVAQKRESKLENWTAAYNEQDKQLHENKKGKLISFNPEQRSLLVGTSEYKKVE